MNARMLIAWFKFNKKGDWEGLLTFREQVKNLEKIRGERLKWIKYT